MEILIDEFGTFLGKKSERVQIKRNGKVESEHPLFDVEQITIASWGVSLSTDLIEECVSRGIQINFLDAGGEPYAKLTSPSLSATATRANGAKEKECCPKQIIDSLLNFMPIDPDCGYFAF